MGSEFFASGKVRAVAMSFCFAMVIFSSAFVVGALFELFRPLSSETEIPISYTRSFSKQWSLFALISIIGGFLCTGVVAVVSKLKTNELD